MSLSIELWAERDISYAEIRRRLKEHSDEDCAMATAMLLRIGDLDADTRAAVAILADDLRDTRKILDFVEGNIRAGIAANVPHIEPDVLAQFMELTSPDGGGLRAKRRRLSSALPAPERHELTAVTIDRLQMIVGWMGFAMLGTLNNLAL